MLRQLTANASGRRHPGFRPLHNPFFAEIADGVMSTAERHGFRVLLNTGFMSPTRETGALDTFLELQMDGVLMAGARVETGVFQRVAERVPVVMVTRDIRVPGADVVVNDDIAGAQLAVDHLVELGHRRIAHIDGGAGSGATRRARGFLDAMSRHGLDE